MSERSPFINLAKQRVVPVLAGLSLAAAAAEMADSSQASPNPQTTLEIQAPPKAEDTLERCFSKPRPRPAPIPQPPSLEDYEFFEEYEQATLKWERRLAKEVNRYEANTRTIRLQATKSSIVGDPGELTPAVQRKVDGAVVKVKVDGAAGSGVIIENSEGEDLVLTAAHATERKPLNKIEVIDSKGQTTRPIGGCFIYDHNGRFWSFNYKQPAETDIAVLKLEHDIGSTALKLSDIVPKRGDWVFFENYQLRTMPPEAPKRYGGIVLTNDWLETRFKALTGLQYWREDNYALRPGGSGGVVVDKDGGVVGISTSVGTKRYRNKKWLEDKEKVIITGIPAGNRYGLFPVDGNMQHKRTIRTALSSPTLDR